MNVKQSLYTLACTISLLLAGQAGAAMVVYDYSADLSLNTGTDNLGINGQTLSFTLTFDTENAWTQSAATGAGLWYVPVTSFSVSLTGGHTIDLKSPDPILAYQSSTGGMYFRESTLVNNYMGFVIDGTSTLIGAFVVTPLVAPSLGGAFVQENLSLETNIFSTLTTDPGLQNGFSFTNPTVSVSTVPIPAAVWLFGSGLMGLLAFRRKSRQIKPVFATA